LLLFLFYFILLPFFLLLHEGIEFFLKKNDEWIDGMKRKFNFILLYFIDTIFFIVADNGRCEKKSSWQEMDQKFSKGDKFILLIIDL